MGHRASEIHSNRTLDQRRAALEGFKCYDRRDDAIATLQEAVKLDPDYIYTYITLAIAQAELGRAEKAAAAVENILRIDPDYSLRVFAKSQPFRDAPVLQRHLEGLRKAGLPE